MSRVGKATAIIPARLASTRFPRKALADATGTALAVHVCERAAAATSIDRVVVATDAEEIASIVRAAGYDAVMTSPDHDNGTSRLAEAATKLGLAPDEVIVNVQGDEPEIEPGTIDASVDALGHDSASVGTVASPFGAAEDATNPNIVKAVVGLSRPDTDIGPALLFSRACVPFDRDGVGVRRLRHVGIYAYTAGALQAYVRLAPTPLEQAERLEQLRWLEHGMAIGIAIRPTNHVGIDTPEQYADFVARHESTSRSG